MDSIPVSGRLSWAVPRRSLTRRGRHAWLWGGSAASIERAPVPGLHGEFLHRFERTVSLDDRHEDLVEPVILVRSKGHDQTADREYSRGLDGRQQTVAAGVGSGLLERGRREPADQVAFERHEGGLRLGGRRLE